VTPSLGLARGRARLLALSLLVAAAADSDELASGLLDTDYLLDGTWVRLEQGRAERAVDWREMAGNWMVHGTSIYA
jgi:hypothetical protein